MLDRPVTNRGWVAAILVALGVPQALTGLWALLALGYAVELGLLGSNPVDRIQWTAPAVAVSVDRGSSSARPRPGCSWTPAGRLGRRGEHLKTFFACLYHAALRPSEAVMLREADLHLPKAGWGWIVLSASASRAGRP